MKLIIAKLFNPLHTYSICKNNLIKFRDDICNSGHCATSTYYDIACLDHIKGSTNLTLKPSINVDVTLNSPEIFYLSTKYITITIDFILKLSKNIISLDQINRTAQNVRKTNQEGWLASSSSKHTQTGRKTNREGWLASSPSKHTNVYPPMPLQYIHEHRNTHMLTRSGLKECAEPIQEIVVIV